MDINDLYTVESHEAGAEMQVQDDKGKLLDIYITMIGTDSKLWRKISLEGQRKALKEGADLFEIKAEALSQAALDWRGAESEGKEVEFSQEAIKTLYLNAPYIADQADRFIANRLNFTIGKAN